MTWERIKTWNAGFDFGFLKQRVSGSFDIYRKGTYGNIIDQQLSYTSGFASNPINAGTVLNKGVELALNADVVRLRDFRWSVGGNISYNHNEVTSLGQVRQFVLGTSLVKVGLPLGSHYIPKWAGVDASSGAGLYYDSTGKLISPVYDQSQSVAVFGSYNAPWIGGFNTGFYYKGFSLEAFFTFQEGFTISNNQDYFQTNPAFVLQGYNVRTDVLTMWQKPGDVTDIQNATTQTQFSSKFVQDASYVQFREPDGEPTISHRALVAKTKVFSAARLCMCMGAEPAYTWTKLGRLRSGVRRVISRPYAYPVPRTYTVGVTTSFNLTRIKFIQHEKKDHAYIGLLLSIGGRCSAACKKQLALLPSDSIPPASAFTNVLDLQKGLYGVYGANNPSNKTYIGAILADEAKLANSNRGQGQLGFKWQYTPADNSDETEFLSDFQLCIIPMIR